MSFSSVEHQQILQRVEDEAKSAEAAYAERLTAAARAAIAGQPLELDAADLETRARNLRAIKNEIIRLELNAARQDFAAHDYGGNGNENGRIFAAGRLDRAKAAAEAAGINAARALLG